MKKNALILLASVVFSIVLFDRVKAGPAEFDIACLPGSGMIQSEIEMIGDSRMLAQTFIPSENTLDTLYLGIHSSVEGAKAEVYIGRYIPGQRTEELAHKYITTSTRDAMQLIQFDNLKIYPGEIHVIAVAGLESRKRYYWTAVGSMISPYLGGVAIINGGPNDAFDMVFGIVSHNSEGAGEPYTNTTPGPNDSSTEPNTSTSSGPDTSDNTSVNTSNQPDPSATVSTPTGSLPSTRIIPTEGLPRVTDETNTAVATDQNNEELIASAFFLIEEFQKRHPRGAFGLGGVAGEYFTWSVFYGICAVIFIIVMLIMVISIRAKKKRSNIPPPAVSISDPPVPPDQL